MICPFCKTELPAHKHIGDACDMCAQRGKEDDVERNKRRHLEFIGHPLEHKKRKCYRVAYALSEARWRE